MIDRLQAFYRLLALLLLISASSCTALTQTQRGAYSEDLSKHRRTFKEPLQETGNGLHQQSPQKPILTGSSQPVTEQLDSWLEEKKKMNQKANQIPGYTIQVYKGRSRDNALKTKNQVHQYYPDLQPKISYNETNYTVRIGNFLDRQEVYETYLLVKRRMPRAIIRPILLANTPYSFSNKPTDEGTKDHE